MRKTISVILVILSLGLLSLALSWDLINHQRFSFGLRQIGLIALCLICLFLAILASNNRLRDWVARFLSQSFETIKLLMSPSRGKSLLNDQSIEEIERPKNIYRSAIILAVILICIAIVAVIGLSAPISQYRIPLNDSGIFAYFGRQILNGKVLYTQLFDHKPPFIFYLNALGALFSRESFWGVWIIELASIFISSFLIFRFIKKYFGLMPAFIALIPGIINLVIPLERGNLTEEYTIAFQVLAIFLVTSDRFKGKDKIQYFLIGLCGGIAFLFKTNSIGLWIAIGALLLVRISKKNFGHILYLGMGFAAVNLLMIIIFAVQGNLSEYFLVAYRYNFLTSEGTSGRFGSIMVHSINTYVHMSLFYAFCLIAWGYQLIRLIIFGVSNGVQAVWRNKYSSLSILLVVWFPIEMILANFSGREFLHYYIFLWVSSVMLFAFFVHDFGSWLFRSRFKLKTFVPVILFGITLISPSSLLYRVYNSKDIPIEIEASQYIQANSKPGDKVFVFGMRPILYYLSNRESASRYIFTDPLHNPGYATNVVVDAFVDEFIQNSPSIIVDTLDKFSPRISQTQDGKCSYTEDTRMVSLNPMYEYICANYKFVKTLTPEEWPVYVRVQ